MKSKKSSFLAFWFSLIPGAGQMYIGFMKRGVSVMSAFWLLIFFAAWLNISPLLFAMPVIWFFSFFDTHNLRSLSDTELNAVEDGFLLIPEFAKEKSKLLKSKYRNVIAFILIIIGFAILFNNTYNLLDGILPYQFMIAIDRFGHFIPQLLVGAAIIALGLYLINGKKKELDTAANENKIDDMGGYKL